MIMIFFDIDVHKRIDNNPCDGHFGLNYDDDNEDDGLDDEGVTEYMILMMMMMWVTVNMIPMMMRG